MRTVILFLGFASLAACSWLSPEQKELAQQAYADMLANGTITQEQYDAIMAALSQGDWSKFADIGIAIGVSILGALTGIRIVRGPSATQAERVARLAAKTGVKA